MLRSKPLCVADFKQRCGASIPGLFFDYINGGSYSETTMRNNELDLARLAVIQRAGVDVSKRSIKTNAIAELLGRPDLKPSPLPVGVSPVGFTGMFRGSGEIYGAHAAFRSNVPFCLSTMSITSIEQVADALAATYGTPGDLPLFWHQLYFLKDRGFMKSLIQRVSAAGCGALVVTLDLQILAQRHKDVRNGLSAPPNLLRPKTAAQILSRPAWCLSMTQARSWNFGNIVGHVSGVEDVSSLSSWTNDQFDPSMSWRDVEWIRRTMDEAGMAEKPLIVKGLLHPDDAVDAARTGACAAVICCNHGGRCLDAQHGAIRKLHPMARALDDFYTHRSGDRDKCTSGWKQRRMQLHFASGIRLGSDLFKALNLGADFCWVGRPFAWALGSDQRPGLPFSERNAVDDLFEVLRKELDVTTALAGVRDLVAQRSPAWLDTDAATKQLFGIDGASDVGR